MGRGLGQRQLTILGVLARYEASGESELYGLRVEEIALQPGPSIKESASARSSIRRALAKMWSKGLVDKRYYPHRQGRPRLWKITDAGLAEMDRRRAQPVR
jgi:DNA-binding MarR family transcriptional regulator